MAQAIAVVVAVTGRAFARDVKGNLRPLKAGDTLQEGEVVITMSGGHVELAMADGAPMAIASDQTVTLTAEVSATTRPGREDAQVSQDTVDQVIQALEQGGNLDDIEAPAAGLAGGGGGEGSNFVRLLRISEGVNPLDFEYRQETTNRVQAEEATLAAEEPAIPRVAIDIVDSQLNDTDASSLVTFTFTTAPTGFAIEDVAAVGGTVSNLQPTDDPHVFTATFTATDGFAGTASVSVSNGAYTDAAGTPGTGGSDSVPVDRSNPELTLDIVIGQLNDTTNTSPVTFTFTEPPVGFTIDDVIVVGGVVTNLQPTDDPRVYTGTFTANDGFTGTGTVSVADGTYTDVAGNPGTGDIDTVPVDTANPSLTLDIEIAELNDGEISSPVTFTFSEAPVGFTIEDVIVDGGTVTNLQPTDDPRVYTGTFTATDGYTGTGTVSVADGAYTDDQGNLGTGDVDTVPIDRSNPTLPVNIVDTQLNDADNSSVVTFTFSEAPVGFTIDDIDAVGGTVTNLQPTADPLVFTATFTATEGFTGTASVSVADGTYTDIHGNVGTGGSDTVPVDTLNPTLAVDIVDAALNDGDPSSVVTFTFSEAPAGFSIDDIVAVGGAVTDLQPTADPLVFTATFTATDGFSGTAGVSVTDGAYTDAQGNVGTGGSDTVPVDRSNPTLAVDIVDAALNDGDSSSLVTFTFSEAPVGFTADDIIAIGGAVTDLQPTADPKVFTATFTATDGFSGTASVSIADNLYTDAAGNQGTGGSDTVPVDRSNPTLAVDIVDAALNDGDPSSVVTFTFSEAPVGFSIDDIVAVGGAVTDLQPTADPLVFTGTFTATDGFSGTAGVSVADGAYTDAQGNVGTGGSDTVPVDRSNPTLAVDIVDAALNDGDASSLVTFTFSEAPVGFSADDIVAIGGAVTELQPTADPLVFTATFTATDGFSGTASVSVADNLYTDAAGNQGTGGSDTVPVDRSNPTLAVDIVDAALNDSDTSSVVTFTFSEAPVGFSIADIVAVGGAVTDLQPTADPLVFTATFTATDGFSGTAGVSVADGAYTDAQGNVGAGGSDTVPVDRSNPTLAVDIVDAALNDSDVSSVVTFTFSEAPVGFSETDIVAVGGTVTNLQPTADPLVFTATFTATDGFSGSASVSVADNLYTDAAGNQGTGGSDTVPVDTLNPSLAVDIVDPALNDADTSSLVTFTFSTAPVGFDENDIFAVGGTVTGLTATADPKVFTATFTATDGFAGTAGVSVADGAYTDAQGNVGAGGSDTVPVDRSNPTLAVDIVDAALNDSDVSSVVTFTFSEAPVGFSETDIVAVGGTVTGLTATADPKVFTATFTATDGFSGTAS
ncbi:MAG: hypothetical protein AzoDbin1_01330, partial [Azoarcus sp.]|nr:hypothetical protein [Azoarcus sp.]